MTKTLRPFLPGKSGRRRGARNDDPSANAMKHAATTPSPILWPVVSPASSTGAIPSSAKPLLVAPPPGRARPQTSAAARSERARDDQGVERDRPLEAEEADGRVEHPAEAAAVVGDRDDRLLRAEGEGDPRRRAGGDGARARVQPLRERALRLREPDLEQDALRVGQRRVPQRRLQRGDRAAQLRDLRRLDWKSCWRSCTDRFCETRLPSAASCASAVRTFCAGTRSSIYEAPPPRCGVR